MSIAIVDYGMGNLGSVSNMLKRVGVEAVITSDPEVILGASKLILPGVGSFDNGMANLSERGLKGVLERKVLAEKTPILGICLGMQLFSGRSEEGTLPGLGWIDAETVRFRFPPEQGHLKVPHMGWNNLSPAREHPLLSGFDEPPRFYFVHSFHVRCARREDVLATCHYGFDFTASVWHENILGTQFHPEKSHKFGMRVLSNFAGMA
jgi:imidazole glycerol-phosphate synthase subunit HisH